MFSRKTRCSCLIQFSSLFWFTDDPDFEPLLHLARSPSPPAGPDSRAAYLERRAGYARNIWLVRIWREIHPRGELTANTSEEEQLQMLSADGGEIGPRGDGERNRVRISGSPNHKQTLPFTCVFCGRKSLSFRENPQVFTQVQHSSFVLL